MRTTAKVLKLSHRQSCQVVDWRMREVLWHFVDEPRREPREAVDVW